MPMTQDTPWLDETEMRAWRGFVEVGGRVIQGLDSSLKESSGMTFDDYEVLVHLSEAPERRLRMTELSQRLLHSQSRLTQRVDRLVKRGWVSREKCDEDRRGTFAVLTAEGFAAIEDAAPHHVADVRRLLLDHIRGDEMATMAEIFERIADAARGED
jgi:DNA-binding MarR family transcriptional regulator